MLSCPGVQYPEEPTGADFFKKLIYLINLLLAALAFRCCVQAFSSCGERGPLFVEVRGLLVAGACLVAEHGL